MISECYPSPHNGLTMCVGSYASRTDNDINTIVSEFARNVSINYDKLYLVINFVKLQIL